MASINPGKTQSSSVENKKSEPSIRQDMERETKTILQIFTDRKGVSPEYTFDKILNYIAQYDRFLYSTISNQIYAMMDSSKESELVEVIVSNLEILVEYTVDSEKMFHKLETTDQDKKNLIEKTKKVILKIWDHVNLAVRQYHVLKQTDEEYEKRFEKQISVYKEKLTKDMNSQMITMVGIFTALAFLIFGSISSLDNIFTNIKIPLMKAMSIGLIWGLCVLNLVFVFMYCIGKMSELKLSIMDDQNATVFQKYPVVWWSNITLISLLIFTTWTYFIQQHIAGNGIIMWITNHPKMSVIGGYGIVALITITLIFFTAYSTKRNKSIKKKK